MQPVISPIGHGSSHNSYGADEDLRTTEATPLIRFPPRPRRFGVRTMAVIGVLVGMLVAGIGISIYLLILQYNSDNVLPPVNPENGVSQAHPSGLQAIGPIMRQRVRSIIVVQTDSDICNDDTMCYEILKELQRTRGRPLPYNYMVSSNGQTFKGLGWNRISPMFPQYLTMVVAFIGNFTVTPPTTAQLEEAFALFDQGIKLGFLHPEFRIIGKITKSTPTYLFDALHQLPVWDPVHSDMY